MQQLPNGLKCFIRRISPKINIHVDFLAIHRCMTTNYTVQIKDALHYFSASSHFRVSSIISTRIKLNGLCENSLRVLHSPVVFSENKNENREPLK